MLLAVDTTKGCVDLWRIIDAIVRNGINGRIPDTHRGYVYPIVSPNGACGQAGQI